MWSSLIIAFREGLESFLIVGIILAYLIKINRKDLNKIVYLGSIIGLFISLIGGYIGFIQAQELGEEGEELFEGIMMLLSSGLILYFVVWMGNQSKELSSKMHSKITENTKALSLFALTFLAVFREGMEMVIFNLTKINEHANLVVMGSIIGIIISLIVAYIIFKTSVKLNLKYIFKVLGLVIIFLGAEMFAEGILTLFEIKIEIVEISLILLYLIPTFYLFFNEEIKNIMNKNKNI